MKKETQQKLELFAKHNNWQLPHPLDMERFYEFVIEAYNNGDIEISDDEFFDIISPFYKMDEKEQSKWIIRFENGTELLDIYNKNK